MVEIIVNNEILEIPKSLDFKYSVQNTDIFDIGSIKANYTNSFKIEKTPKNTSVFEQLGVVGDTSSVPYRKIPASVKFFGFDVIVSGWLDVKETAESYQISIIDGVIDFFKDIENKSIGKDLNITALSHQKNIESVVSSFTNENYRYLIADFDGKSIVDGKLNVDFLTPFIRAKYLMNNIFSKFGYNYSGEIFNKQEWQDLWISYNKPTPQQGSDVLEEVANVEENSGRNDILSFYSTGSISQGTYQVVGTIPIGDIDLGFESWDIINSGTFIGNSFVIQETGVYKFDISFLGYVIGYRQGFPNRQDHLKLRVLKNGISQGALLSGQDSELQYEVYLNLNEGDVFSFQLFVTTSFNYFRLRFFDLNIKMKISKSNVGLVNFQESLKDFKIKDFIKEICIRLGLIVNYNSHNKNLEFYTYDEIFNKNNVIDWSDKFIKRKKEVYKYSSLAQQNAFRHKYNDEFKEYNDGFLYTNNKNLDEIKNIFVSKFFSSSEESINFLGQTTYKLPTYKAEVKDNNGEVEIDYKSLDGRFYTAKSKQINQTLGLISETFNNSQTVTSFPFVDLSQNYYQQLIQLYYSKTQGILEDLRVHNIELALGLEDIMNLDLKKIYYFKQEKQFYILNKINFDFGKKATGEFIRIKL